MKWIEYIACYRWCFSICYQQDRKQSAEYSSGNRSICFGGNRRNFDRWKEEHAMNKIELKPCPN